MKKSIISRNIRLLMKHFNIRNGSQLAQCVGMSPVTTNRLISGVSADPRISTLIPIAEHFKVSLDALTSNNPMFTNNKNHKPEYMLIPVLNYNELTGMHDKLNSLTFNNWTRWYPLLQQETQEYYAVDIRSQKLSTPFEKASLLVVKDESKLANNSYCLLQHRTSKSINLKKVACDNGKQFLLSLQPELPISEFKTKDWLVLGTIQALVTDISNGDFIHLKNDE